ncbi:MAG TPA: tyrosine--tRNA ligase [Clostridia bacterium]
MTESVFDTLKDRGYLAQVTDEEAVRDVLSRPGVSFYIGFDPTADSLHVGHFIQMMVMAHMQRAGHRPIVLLGGGTAMVGDPSGRTDMRSMLNRDTIVENVARFREQMRILLDFEQDRAILADNADWLMDLNYIDFLRDIGSCFSVNRMLSADCFRQRMEKGLSFLEFNYMVMQAYDFLVLYQRFGCRLELGGDDQWSNILAGIDLVRRKEQATVYGMTFRLLTTSEGTKMGKTARGALWLDRVKTPPFDFYQYWRNIDDPDVENCMKLLTFLPLSKIAAYHFGDERINEAKKRLAYEVTTIVHGKADADSARQQAEELFERGGRSDAMSSTSLSAADMADGCPLLLDVLVQAGVIPSKGEGRRLILQSGLFLNDLVVTDLGRILLPSDFTGGEAIVRKGKKVYHRLVIG